MGFNQVMASLEMHLCTDYASCLCLTPFHSLLLLGIKLPEESTARKLLPQALGSGYLDSVAGSLDALQFSLRPLPEYFSLARFQLPAAAFLSLIFFSFLGGMEEESARADAITVHGKPEVQELLSNND